MLNPIYLKTTTLADAWFTAIFSILENGRKFKIDEGSFAGQERLEFDWVTIHIERPELEMLPTLNPLLNMPNPVDDNYINDYLPYLMTGEEKEGESYTYGGRINKAELPSYMNSPKDYVDILVQGKDIWKNPLIIQNNFLNQMYYMIHTYKNKGFRNNQMILQVGQPTDMLLIDPPCLRHIDTRIQDGKLHFYPYFRSWDLWGGFPANLAAIELMKQYCAAEIGVDNGELIVSSKGLHLYDYTWELAELVRGKTMEEFKSDLGQ